MTNVIWKMENARLKIFALLLNSALERLSKPYVNDAMRRSQSGVSLRDKGWWIEQVPVIDADRADGRVNAQPQPDGVGHVFESDVADEKEHIADVVKRRQPHASSDGIA